MTTSEDLTKFGPLVQEASRAFLEDPRYMISIAERATSVLEKYNEKDEESSDTTL